MDKNTHISDLLNRFITACDEYLANVYSSIQLYTDTSITLFNEQLESGIIEQSFMKSFNAWENFIESLFIAYSMGCYDTEGKLLNKYITPIDAEHAYKIIVGTNQYPDWTDFGKITMIANNFFENGQPFALIQTSKQTFLNMKKIRNHIAHNSNKSLNDFNKMVRSELGYLPSSICCSSFLILKARTNASLMYYELYIDYIKNLATTLTIL